MKAAPTKPATVLCEPCRGIGQLPPVDGFRVYCTVCKGAGVTVGEPPGEPMNTPPGETPVEEETKAMLRAIGKLRPSAKVIVLNVTKDEKSADLVFANIRPMRVAEILAGLGGEMVDALVMKRARPVSRPPIQKM